MSTACKTCGGPLPEQTYGRRRVFCSERCRKRQYDVQCVDCGGRVDGTTPSRLPAEPVCARCSPDHYRTWTREAVVLAIQEWADEHGVPPTATEWNTTLGRKRGLPHRGDFPSVDAVQNAWGSWNAAIAAAGFEPRPCGYWRYGRDGEDMALCEEIRARYEAGESTISLGREYGCHPPTIAYRIKKAGGKVRGRLEAQQVRRLREAA